MLGQDGVPSRAQDLRLVGQREDPGTNWLQKIFDLTTLLNRSDSARGSLDRITEHVQHSLQVDRVAVLLFDENGVMRFKASRGLSAEYRQAVEGHSPWSAGVRDPQAILVPDVLNDTTLSQFHKVILSEGIHALGFIPIVYREILLGKFMIYYNSPHIFTEEELLYSQTAASMVAFALYREHMEQEVRSREAIVGSQLKEKETLLREVHHRVKNSLQVISSLLGLQSVGLEESSARLLKESQNRIRTMSLIHEILYQKSNIARLDLREYITQIATNLYSLYGADPERVTLRIDCNPEYMDPDRAAACGLVVNEVLSNSLRHAFTSDRSGTIHIRFLRQDDAYVLQIGDDGIGLPQGIDFDSQKTLGLRLISTLVSQLNGTVRIDRSHGTVFQIEFP